MSNDITTGELDRRIRDHEKRSAAEHQVIHDRISRVSSESVQVDVHTEIENERKKEIEEVKRRVSALEARPGITLGRAVVAITVLVGILGLLIQAYTAVKGAK